MGICLVWLMHEFLGTTKAESVLVIHQYLVFRDQTHVITAE